MMPQLFGGRPAATAGATPQSIPLQGQVANNAGGYYYAVDDWMRFDRFLLLGTEDGTHYVSAIELTRQNAEGALRCMEAAAVAMQFVRRERGTPVVAFDTAVHLPAVRIRCRRWRATEDA
jgi:hypothetical protein